MHTITPQVRGNSTVICRAVLVLFLLGLLCPAVRGGAQAAAHRDKIGIAFCGGGALGMTHIGVIKWLEEHHIPVDYVTGTSAGGLIASFYCMGMSAGEIRATLMPMNWEEALATETPFGSASFRRKEDQRAVPTRFELSMRRGFAPPSGLMAGHPIGLLLSKVCAPYSDIASFDELPTPFRCQGVDLDAGTLVTFKDGSLLTALRTTMAAPGFFTPFRRNGKNLVDPGLLANIPTEALKEMRPDIIIAVELTDPPGQQPDKQSFGDVLKRTIFISNRLADQRSLRLADIVVTTDIRGLNAMDFSRIDPMMERGYRAADARAKILQRLALNDADWDAYVAGRRSRRRGAATVPAFLEVEGTSSAENERLKHRLSRVVGAPFDAPGLERELTAIAGEGRYNAVLYEWVHRDGTAGIRIVPQKRQSGSPFIKLGVAVNGADTDNIKVDTLARIRALDAGAPGAEVRADLRFGTDRDLDVEYYRPLPKSRAFLAPHLFVTDDSRSIFAQGLRTAIYSTKTAGAGLDLGYNTSRQSEVRFGYQWNALRSSVRTGSPLLPPLAGSASVLALRWRYDGQDSENIPMRGSRIDAEGYWYYRDPGAPKPFPKLDLRLSSYHAVSARNSIYFNGGIGTTFGAQAGPLEQFTAGGPMRLAAFGPEEFRGNSYGYASVGALQQIGRLPPYLGGRILAFTAFELGGAFAGFDHARYRSDVSAGFVAETLLGPIMAGASAGEGGRKRFYFALGRLF